MSSTPTRPANRPSRRHELVEAAVELFALQPWDVVTVNDIVTSAGMTLAAFYYHFESKIQLLEEIVHDAAPAWEEAVATAFDAVDEPDDFDGLTSSLMAWLDNHLALAAVLVHAPGASDDIDETVGRVRATLVRRAAEAVGRLAPACVPARRDVVALALVNVLELGASARVQVDDVYRTLGPRRYGAEVANVARLVLAAAAA